MKNNREANKAVGEAVYWSVRFETLGAMRWGVRWDVEGAVNWDVFYAVDRAVDRAVKSDSPL